jgi:antitoxin (DNA-binding transcriptional repressor) of toxin-antitoxin stability system
MKRTVMKGKTIGAAKFKEHCLSLLDNLDPEGLIVTKHGKPVAHVLPLPTSPEKLIGSLKQKLLIKGDVMTTNVTWQPNAQP